MRSLLLVCLLALASLQTITHVEADSVGMFVQDANNPGVAGYFSEQFVGMRLVGSHATLTFYAGSNAYGDYVISTNLGGNAAQSVPFDVTVPTSVTVTFTATGTYWIYLAGVGSTANVDWLEVRIVPSTWSGMITAAYTDPPAGWTTGYPPAAAWLETTNPATVTTSSSSSSSSPSSTSTVAVWLAPLLVGVVMAALTVPIAMLAYKKGKAAGMGMDKEQQQQQIELAQGNMHNSV